MQQNTMNRNVICSFLLLIVCLAPCICFSQQVDTSKIFPGFDLRTPPYKFHKQPTALPDSLGGVKYTGYVSGYLTFDSTGRVMAFEPGEIFIKYKNAALGKGVFYSIHGRYPHPPGEYNVHQLDETRPGPDILARVKDYKDWARKEAPSHITVEPRFKYRPKDFYAKKKIERQLLNFEF